MKTFKTIFLILILTYLLGCERLKLNSQGVSQVFGDRPLTRLGDRSTKAMDLATSQGNLAEVATPKIIQELAQELKQYRPQVTIIQPRPETTLNQTDITVKLAVTDLPIFRDDRLGLGNHLNLILDDQAVETIYSLDKPIILKNLAPGTHTIRLVAVSPWGESFKNPGAYAQTTFNILTQTNANRPNQDVPLLTYNSPTGAYGAEPVLLDFYLSDAEGAIAPEKFNQNQWRIRATVNGTSFMIKDWQSYYLTGLPRGENWVQLELTDQMGNTIENAFNDTVRLFAYNPQQQDSLAKLVTNRISIDDAQGIVKQSYYIQPQATPEAAKTSQEKPEITEPKLVEKSQQVELEPNLVENDPQIKPAPEEAQKPKDLINNEIAAATSPQKDLKTTATNDNQEVLTKILKKPVVISVPEIEAKQQPEKKEKITLEAKNLEKINNETPVIELETPLSETKVLPPNNSQSQPLNMDSSDQTTSSTSKQIISIEAKNSDASAPITKIEMPSARVAVEPDKIAITIVPSQETITVPKSPSETPNWWKKFLVGLRHQLEGLAKRLPSQV